ncbi:MAG: hypothetical protein ABSF03_20700 [Streptosporangiaceae bacterium]
MIVVVTGPTAAGKTTWCQRHHLGDLVSEYAPTGKEPGDTDPAAQAAYWSEVNCRRWREATQRERVSGLAVCDDDPLKLHYGWSLVRVGAASPQRWVHEVKATRAAVAAGRLGFADLVLVSLPSPEELRRRRDADPARRRRNFELHARLIEPLRAWYQAVERVEPARVHWGLPSDGLPSVLPPPRANRCDPAFFDALMEALPALP